MKSAVLAVLLIAIGVVARLVPHPENFAPVGAIALFGGAAFSRRWAALLVPLAAMLIGDAFVGFHELMPSVYASYALIAVLGMLLRERRRSVIAVGASSLVASTIFYLVTNLAMWRISYVFPQTWDGLVACYVAGIPYFLRTLLSDLFFSAIFFGTYALVSAAEPRRARA